MPRRKPALIEGGELANRLTEDGRRRIQLTQAERDDAAQAQMIEAAVALYLDVTGRHTNTAIAEELGISVHQLKNLTCLAEFEECWNEHIVDIRHDPRLKATKEHLLDLLPKSLLALGDVLENGTANAKVSAAKEVFRLNGVIARSNVESNRKEMIEFLAEANAVITQNNIQISMPDEYANTMSDYDRALDGEFREVDEDSDAGTEAPKEPEE